MFRKKSLGLVNQRGRSSRSVASGEVKALRLFQVGHDERIQHEQRRDLGNGNAGAKPPTRTSESFARALRPTPSSCPVRSSIFYYSSGKVWLDGNAQKAAPRSVIDSHIQNLAWLKHFINGVIFVH